MKLILALLALIVSFTATAREAGEGAQSPLVCMNRAAFVGMVIESREAKWPERTLTERTLSALEKLHEQYGIPVEEIPLILQEIHNVYAHPDNDYDTLMRSFLRRCAGAVEA